MPLQVATSGVSTMLDIVAEKIGIASYFGTIASLEQRCAGGSESSNGFAEPSADESASEQASVGEPA